MSLQRQSSKPSKQPTPLPASETPVRLKARPKPVYNMPVILESYVKHFLHSGSEDHDEPAEDLRQVLPSYQSRKSPDPQKIAQRLRVAAESLKIGNDLTYRSLARFYLTQDRVKIASDKPAQYLQNKIAEAENELQRRQGTLQTLRDLRKSRTWVSLGRQRPGQKSRSAA